LILLKIRDLATVPALLDGVSIDIHAGKVTALTGRSGAGKTMLARCMAGLLPRNISVNKGTFYYRQRQVDVRRLKHLRGGGIFYTPQNAAASLNPVRKIKSQLAEALEPPPGDSLLADVLESLNMNRSKRVLNAYPFELSEGECRRVLLAMGLLRKPELLILDEPTASLDPRSREHFLRLVEQVQREHCFAVLLITHDLPAAQRLSEAIYTMRGGRVFLEPLNKD
jgi:ABC-type glutathione transport system ATPase component